MARSGSTDFSGRLKRIERIHRRGGGFEADGTLGQSYYTARARTPHRLYRPAFLVACLFIAFKAMILAQQGPGTYTARLEIMRNGSAGQQFSAFVLAIDPATAWLASHFAKIVR